MADETPNTDNKNEVVAKAVYEQTLADYEKTKQEHKETKEKLKNYEKEQENLKVSSLKEKEEWKKLAEIKEKEVEDYKKKLENNSQTTTNYFKRAEIRTQAMKSGIRESALDDLDLLSFTDVNVETTSTGKINVLGADKFVERIKATKPHWFEDKKAPGVDSTNPQVTKTAKPGLKDILKLQKEGKQAEYEAAIMKYKRGG